MRIFLITFTSLLLCSCNLSESFQEMKFMIIAVAFILVVIIIKFISSKSDKHYRYTNEHTSLSRNSDMDKIIHELAAVTANVSKNDDKFKEFEQKLADMWKKQEHINENYGKIIQWFNSKQSTNEEKVIYEQKQLFAKFNTNDHCFEITEDNDALYELIIINDVKAEYKIKDSKLRNGVLDSMASLKITCEILKIEGNKSEIIMKKNGEAERKNKSDKWRKTRAAVIEIN